MANELTNALAQLDTLISGISGVNAAPSDPPTAYTAYPFYVVEQDSGQITKESSGQVRAIHTASVQIHFGLPATLAPSDDTDIKAYVDLVKDKIFLDANLSLSNTVDTISTDEPMTYNWGIIGYRGVVTIGYEFLVSFKIRSVESGGAYAKG